jgi:hypothetical protein
MEEMEVPTEHLHENINEHAEHSKDKWSMYLAVSTAIMAVLAAFGSLLAGHHSNEALISQLKSSDQWAYYQAKGVKYEILRGVSMLDKESKATEALKADMDKYKKEQAEITIKANDFSKESEMNLDKHNTVSYGVTLFQIAIAISAISMLTGKRFLWYFSIVLSLGGVVLLALSYFK